MPLTLEEAARFHGHLGPWLVVGYRAGLRALEVLGKNLRCSVKLPLRTPYTCLLDGLQASSGCTLGKGLIEVSEGDKYDIHIVFTSTSGAKLELRVKRETVDKLEEMLSSTSIEEVAVVVEKWSLRDLFEEKLYL